MSLLHPTRGPEPPAPSLESLTPLAAIPGGCFDVLGQRLLEDAPAPRLPEAFFGEQPAAMECVRPDRVRVRVPEDASSGEVSLRVGGEPSNVLHASVGAAIAEDLHMIANPAVDAEGNVYAMISGARGQAVPVSIVRVSRDLQVRPFVRELMNVSSLAFGPDGHLYASSRAEGTVYRISESGAVSTFAEGMGTATGLAFDRDGNLYVGDRSGTIFKLGPHGSRSAGEVFVFATLEPSMAFYHLAFLNDGTLLVSAPMRSSHQSIFAISPAGEMRTWFQGLGRPQGVAVDEEDNVYVASSFAGRRGIVRLRPTADRREGREPKLVVSGNNLVGMCFLDDGAAALATAETLYHLDLGINGRALL